MKNIKLVMPGLSGRSAKRTSVARFRAIALLSMSLTAVPITASSATLNFEDIGDFVPVDASYVGDGVTFTGDAFVLESRVFDDNNSGLFENQNSGSAAMFLIRDPAADPSASATLNYAAGFTSVSFYYTASLVPGTIRVYDGVDGTGELLVPPGDPFTLPVNQISDCTATTEYTVQFCDWDFKQLALNGVARSIVFGGGNGFIGFDDITLESATVPLPAAAWLLLSGLAGLGFVGRRRLVK